MTYAPPDFIQISSDNAEGADDLVGSIFENQEANADFLALNSGQQAAAHAFFGFLMDPTEKVFRLSGPAGVGKTHWMKFVMRHTVEQYRRVCELMGLKPVEFEFELCATTNKAAEVLAQATGFPAQTIHSFLKLRVRDNYQTGTTEISRTNAWTVHHKKLVFIDEASMVDKELYRFIFEGLDKTCKVVFLGDHCQMAPVFEPLSLVYANPGPGALLSQPMRNAGQPALMALCQQLRDTVENLVFQPIQEVPGVIDILDEAQAYQFIEDGFTTLKPDARMLAFSNARVQEYNSHIRGLRNLPDHFTPGEFLINNTVLTIGKGDSTRLVPIEAEIEVLEIGNHIETIQVDPSDPGATFEAYTMVFREHGRKANNAPTKVLVPLAYARVDALIKHYGRQKNWERLFWLKNTFPDFRQRDAATVYKAQGSTYKTVFLDLANIGVCKHNDQIARMLYVGASRATDRVVCYGELPKRLLSQTYIRAAGATK